jgi:hypothetical protein
MMTVRTAAPSRSQAAHRAARISPKEVTTMIKKIQELLFSGRKSIREEPRDFNGELLDGHREYVFILMHQQMRGLN